MDIVAILRRPRTYVIAAALFIVFTFLGAILFGTLGGGQFGLFGYIQTYGYVDGPGSTFHPFAFIVELFTVFALAVLVQFRTR